MWFWCQPKSFWSWLWDFGLWTSDLGLTIFPLSSAKVSPLHSPLSYFRHKLSHPRGRPRHRFSITVRVLTSFNQTRIVQTFQLKWSTCYLGGQETEYFSHFDGDPNSFIVVVLWGPIRFSCLIISALRRSQIVSGKPQWRVIWSLISAQIAPHSSAVKKASSN